MAVIAAALLIQAAPAPLTLQIRVFNGTEEVTAETRVKIYPAGERQKPVSEANEAVPFVRVSVTPGFYDAQAIREKDGRVLNIRWAERLVVMAYPDEAGRHLEVINFQNGFGALEVRAKDGSPPDAALFDAGARQQEAGRRFDGDGYVLFVAKAGRYDLRLRHGGQTAWQAGIDVPPDRTRFLVAP
jgi:hypothetical protein